MRRITTLTTAAALLLAACSGTATTATTTSTPADGGPRPKGALTGGLQPFDRCDALLEYVQAAALDQVGPYGLDQGYGGPVLFEDEMMTDDVAAAPGERDSAGREAPQAGVDYSTTNVQEAGVDEPDRIKTDGQRLFVSIDGRLHFVDVAGTRPVVRSSLPFDEGYDQQLLLDGDRIFAFADVGGWAVEPFMADLARDEALPFPYDHPMTAIWEIDVSDPDEMAVLSTQYVQGRYVSARMSDGVARVVVVSDPMNLAFVYPSGTAAEAAAEAANRQIIEDSTIENWLPTVVTRDGQGTASEHRLVDCEQVSRPADFSGFGLVSVISFDTDEPLDTAASVGVFGGGETVYASGASLYVATTAWTDPGDQQSAADPTTAIHKFDITGGTPADYVASGSVPGLLIDQFALSEADGVLRAATTVGDMWGGSSESYVTTLAERGDVLEQLGQVGGMGRGESIRSVRFIGDTGYVVTFRQTDPLYVVDLRVAATPVVTGELKINGYSGYLHPVDDDRLIGLGQDATDEGVELGTQLSLFDVSDPTDPRRIQQITFEGGQSEAQWDHHAFTWWEPTDLLVMPLTEYGAVGQFYGAVGLRVADDGISELGRISHTTDEEQCFGEDLVLDEQGNEVWESVPYPCPDYGSQITRAVVVGDEVLTVSSNGLGAHRLDDLTPLGLTPWG